MAFKILYEPAVDAEPCECAFNDPALWQYDKTFGLIGAFDGSNGPWAVALGYRSSIGAISNDFFDERETRRDLVQSPRSTV